jgi:hypothetical protein
VYSDSVERKGSYSLKPLRERIMSSLPNLVVRPQMFRWISSTVALLCVLTLLALTLRPGAILTTVSTVSEFLLISAAALLATENASRTKEGARQFWIFMTAGYGLWAVNLAIWIYYHQWLRQEVPDNSIADIALFLHVVPMIAAVATRPHLKQSVQGIYRARVNFLVLLFFWVFVYAYWLFPYQYLFWNTILYNSRFNHLYFAENVVMVLSVGGQVWFAKRPWRATYFHLWGASFLYGISSLIANIAIDARRYYPGSLYDIPLVAAMCWFLLVPLKGGEPVGHEEERLPIASAPKIIIPLVARLTILAIPLVGVWELFRSESPGMQRFRLLVVLGSVLFLALCVLTKEFLTYRELSSLLRLRGQLVDELQSALSKVKLLSGLLPICSSCKKIRDGQGHWQHLEIYLHEHSEAEFSHGICPDCGRELYGDLYRG